MRRWAWAMLYGALLAPATTFAQGGQGANAIPNPAPPPQSVLDRRAETERRFSGLGGLTSLFGTGSPAAPMPFGSAGGRAVPNGAFIGVSTADARVWHGMSFSTSAPVPAADDFTKGALRPGQGISSPYLRSRVVPAYTADALKAKIEGEVWIEAVVDADGSVTRSRLARSLDRVNGLDDAALVAVRQWRFDPGRENGQPVPVLVTLVIEFRVPR